jgi:hypothetical protein
MSVAESLAALPYVLPQIPYTRLRATLRAREPADLPPFKGSMLRGAFGHALRRTVCAMGPAQPCASCRLRRACVYTRLFETFIEGEPPPFLRGLPTSPRPYVFEPGSEATEVAAGAALCFDLLLIGQARDLAGYAVLAIERMAAAGLGRRRCRFSVERIDAQAAGGTFEEIFPGGNPGAESFAQWLPPPPSSPGERATLRFLTPIRLKSRDHLLAEVGLRGLTFAMIRRTLELAHFHAPGAAIDWTFRPLLDAASAVKVVRSDLRWHDWERYSSRQETTMSLGGFVGTLELAGDLRPLAPLFASAEVLHVGKGATFGLGKVEWSG